MNYSQTLDYLFSTLPMYQRVGNIAFKKDLSNTIRFCEYLDNPQYQFKSVHVAGTNGKGSSSHMLAAILQSAGYKVGLYTSPHLKNFTERIKINGKEIEEHEVVDFVANNKNHLESIKPSFFETTVVMAFDYFAKQKVDIAVIEVGLGGRLDSTNVITPLVSLITNIGYDHQQLLGDTLVQIAGEKAGIIKEGVPVVVSERQPEVEGVFKDKAGDLSSDIVFASDRVQGKDLQLDLLGIYQQKNVKGVLEVVKILNQIGFEILLPAIQQGLSDTIGLTGLKGRWQLLCDNPKIICDTAHNQEGIELVLQQLNSIKFNQLHVVWGMVNDKAIDNILKLLPKDANYYYCEAKIPRALNAKHLCDKALQFGLKGVVIEDVNSAIEKAKQKAHSNDLIFIGGSTFVVAEINDL
jgi:dihydrofolate synthase/folylpolyglutamate synthase